MNANNSTLNDSEVFLGSFLLVLGTICFLAFMYLLVKCAILQKCMNLCCAVLCIIILGFIAVIVVGIIILTGYIKLPADAADRLRSFYESGLGS